MSSYDQSQTADLLQRLHKEISQMRVLLIDRHNSARNSLRIILSTLGVSAVHNAASATEVLRQVRAHPFDIILADYQLDGDDTGLDCIRALRSTSGQEIPAVLITANRDKSVTKTAEKMDVSVMTKPVHLARLRSLIDWKTRAQVA